MTLKLFQKPVHHPRHTAADGPFQNGPHATPQSYRAMGHGRRQREELSPHISNVAD
jgi:hypothetical protein